MITGSGIIAIRVSGTFMPNMNTMLITSRIAIRIRPVICSEIKFRVVSISLVHRWMMSPVWFCICHWNGSRSMWLYSSSRMVFASVSLPLVFVTRKPYWVRHLTSAIATTASAIIHRLFRIFSGPPSIFRNPAAAGLSASMLSPASTWSTVIRMICGVIMSARADSAAQIIAMIKKPLLPFRK